MAGITTKKAKKRYLSSKILKKEKEKLKCWKQLLKQ